MFQLDDKFLQDLGLGSMPDDQKQAFLQHLYEELELRVGTRLSEGMTDEQLSDFEKLIDANDQQGALRWLETNRPNYKQVVAEELEKLRQEVLANRDRILADLQEDAQNANAAPATPEQDPALQQPGQSQQPQSQDPTELQIH